MGPDHGVTQEKVSHCQLVVLPWQPLLRLLDMVKECFGLAVAKNVDDIKPDHLPVILIVYKSKGQVEVRNIIQGTESHDPCFCVT